jgi:hypothetical protein
MQQNSKRKLELNRETIRALTAREMSGVAGGRLADPTVGCSETCPTGGYCPAPPLTAVGCTNGCTVAIVGRRMR